MSVLIRGMEMPTDDSMIFAIRHDGMVEDVMGCYVGKAVPVPPHGKLIDTNKLIKRLQKQLNEAQAKVRAMGELNIGYTPDMYIVDRNRDMISILTAQAAFLPEEIKNETL